MGKGGEEQQGQRRAAGPAWGTPGAAAGWELRGPWSLPEEEVVAPWQAGALSPGALGKVVVLPMGTGGAPWGQGSLQDRPLNARTSRRHQYLVAGTSPWGMEALKPKLGLHCRRQVMEAHGGLGMGEGATKLALEAQGVPGAGKGAHRGSGEGRAWRRRGPSARQRMAPAAPRIPEPGQPGRGEQRRRAE